MAQVVRVRAQRDGQNIQLVAAEGESSLKGQEVKLEAFKHVVEYALDFFDASLHRPVEVVSMGRAHLIVKAHPVVG